MKIIFIRHGEPDNKNNTLTEQGFKEAAALAKMYKDMEFTDAYVSPLMRAKLTCEAVLSPSGRTAKECEWLAEFRHMVKIPSSEERVLNWDFMPSFFTSQEDFYKDDEYLDNEVMKSADMKREYLHVCEEFDKILEEHGYKREGRYYKVTKENRGTLVFFCHFAIMAVMMSHMMGIPYVLITQMFMCAPTGVTVLNSEEREKGIALFRCSRYGDISHLVKEGIEPSFHGRFCETFSSDERH